MTESYDIFLSHSSADKVNFVRPLAEQLGKFGLKVWYDEYVIAPGDSIFSQISDGLRKSHIGVVVLSEAFFESGWTRAELAALFSAMLEQKSALIPIWHGVSRKHVNEFSPLLTDLLALNSQSGVERCAEAIARALNKRALGEETAARFRNSLSEREEGRRFLEEKLTTRIFQKRKKGQASVVMLDIDGLTKINGRFGDEVGELVLDRLQKSLKLELRENSADVGRCGDDTFYAVVYGVERKWRDYREGDKAETPFDFVDGLRLSIKDQDWGKIAHELWATCSVGYALHLPTEEGVDTVIRACVGMREAKRLGGDQTCIGPFKMPYTPAPEPTGKTRQWFS